MSVAIQQKCRITDGCWLVGTYEAAEHCHAQREVDGTGERVRVRRRRQPHRVAPCITNGATLYFIIQVGIYDFFSS